MGKVKVIHEKNYTVMCNYHFREKSMSLKAKGLLSLMLSLPDEWNYTVEGLVELSEDGSKSVRAGLKELEEFGYLQRIKKKSEKGLFSGIDYLCYEIPHGRDVNGPKLSDVHCEQGIVNSETSAEPILLSLLRCQNHCDQHKVSDIVDILERFIRSKAKNLSINGTIVSRREFLSLLDYGTDEHVKKILACGYPSSNPYTYWTTVVYNTIKYECADKKVSSRSNSFSLFEQQEYDFEELERMLVK